METLSAEMLPRPMTTEWTELSSLQKQSTKADRFRDLRQNPLSAFILGALPMAVVPGVPMSVLSALVGITLAHMYVNIFVQVAFVVLVSMASKNALLIVEFAREQEGASRFGATAAATVRLRPIPMTSFAFVLGVFPLVIAHGAKMRRMLDTAVVAGMLGVTLFGLFLTPVFYSVIRRLAERPLGAPVWA